MAQSQPLATPGELVARYRGMYFLSQQSLGALLDVSTDTVRRIEGGTYGNLFREKVERLIDILRITDTAEQTALRSAAGQDVADPQSETTPPTDEPGRVNDDAFVRMLCQAVEQGSVSEAHAVDLAKQAQFMRGGPWHDRRSE